MEIEQAIVLNISLVEGEFEYRTESGRGHQVKLKPDDRFTFHFEQPFAIRFKGLSPFTTTEPLDGSDATHKNYRVSLDALAGSYPYTVAAADGSRVYVDDPEVVIVRPGNYGG
jgi:hypothetical protein